MSQKHQRHFEFDHNPPVAGGSPQQTANIQLLNQQFAKTTPKNLNQRDSDLKAMILPQAQNQSQNSSLEVDFVVRNVYSKIKSLESKYMDLANYYKDAAATTSAKMPSSMSAASTIAPQPMGATTNLSQESSMIRDLLEQKRDLEDNISSLKNAVHRPTTPQTSHQPPHQAKQVVGTLCAEIQQELDTAQNKNLQALSQKQNEMFQVASKHKVPTAFKNETLGLWYDAKASLNQNYEDLKEKLLTQQNKAEAQLGVTFLANPQQQEQTLSPSQIQTQLVSEIISQFEYRSRKHAKKLDKLQSHFQNIDQALQSERHRAQQLINDLSQPSSTTSKQSGYQSPFTTTSGQKRPQTSYNKKSQSGSKRGVNLSADKYSQQSSLHQVSTNSQQPSLDSLKHCFEQIQSGEQQKDILSQNMFKVVESVLQQNFTHVQKMQPLGQAAAGQQQPGQEQKVQELQFNNEQLFAELRQQSDKYVDLRVENSKLREQISSLSKPSQAQHPSQSNPVLFRNFSTDLCTLVSQFMHAMRQLQKAVNKKEPDVSLQKQNFESAKHDLQSLVQTVKDYLQQPMQSPNHHNEQQERLKSMQSRSPSRDRQKPTVSSSQLSKVPALVQNVKNLQLEKQKLQELVTELKQVHQIEQQQLKQKLQAKIDAIQKFAAQCSQLMVKQSATDSMVMEIKKLVKNQPGILEEMFRLETQCQERISQDQQKVPANLKLDPQMLALKDELQQQIAKQTFKLEHQVEQLMSQLSNKEDSLARVKHLFIQKLHELESSFADVTAVVEEVDLQQSSQKVPTPVVQPSHLERSVESVLSKFEQDDREKDIDQLLLANQDLMHQNFLLKQTQSQPKPQQEAQLEFVLELQQNYDICKQEKDRLQQQSKDFETQCKDLQQKVQSLKYDNKRQGFDLKDLKSKNDRSAQEYQAQFNALKLALVQQKQAHEQSEDSKQQLESKLGQFKESYQILKMVKEDLEAQGLIKDTQVQESRDELLKQHNRLEQEREEMEQEVVNLQAQIQNIQEQNYARVEALSSEIIDLKEQLVQQTSEEQLVQSKPSDQVQALQNELQQTTEELDRQLSLHEQELTTEKQKHQSQEQLFNTQISNLTSQLEQLLHKYERPVLNPQQTSDLLDSHMQSLKQSSPKDLDQVSFTFVLKLLQATQSSYILLVQSNLKLDNDLAEKTVALKELKDELKEAAQESLDFQMKLNEIQRQKESCVKDDASLMLEFKQKEVHEMTEKLGRMSSEHAQMKTQLGNVQAELDQVQKSQQRESQSYKEEVQLKSKESKRVSKECDDVKHELTESQDQVKKLRQVQLNLKSELDSSNLRCQEAYEKEATLEDSLQSLKTEKANLLLEIDSLKKVLEDKQMEHEARLEAVISQKENEMFDRLDDKFDEFVKEKSHLQGLISDKEDEVSEWESKVQQQNQVLEKQEKEISELRSKKQKSGLVDMSLTKGIRLVLALQSHFKAILSADLQSTKQELSILELKAASLEDQANTAEFKQVQLEGNLKQEKDAFDKYKKDANFLLQQSLRKQSDLKKSEQELAQEMKHENQKLVKQMTEAQDECKGKEEQLEKTQKQLSETLIKLEDTIEHQLSETEQGRMMLDLEKQNEQLGDKLQGMSERMLEVREENNRLKAVLESSSQDKRSSWDQQNVPLNSRGSWGSSTSVQTSADVEEHLKHIRSIMAQFMQKLPYQAKENEELLPILFSMLNFNEEEISQLIKARDEHTQLLNMVSTMQQNSKGAGIFGFGKKSK